MLGWLQRYLSVPPQLHLRTLAFKHWIVSQHLHDHSINPRFNHKQINQSINPSFNRTKSIHQSINPSFNRTKSIHQSIDPLLNRTNSINATYNPWNALNQWLHSQSINQSSKATNQQVFFNHSRLGLKLGHFDANQLDEMDRKLYIKLLTC